MGCHVLLQGIFPTQGLNLGLLHCRQILYRLSYKGSPLCFQVYCIWYLLPHDTNKLLTSWLYLHKSKRSVNFECSYIWKSCFKTKGYSLAVGSEKNLCITFYWEEMIKAKCRGMCSVQGTQWGYKSAPRAGECETLQPGSRQETGDPLQKVDKVLNEGAVHRGDGLKIEGNKSPWCWERLKAGRRRGRQRIRRLDGIPD